MPATSNQNRNITRAVTYAKDGSVKAAGWIVRFSRGGENYQSFFGDAKHGGQRKSLASAREDRDAQEPKFERIKRAIALQHVAELTSPGNKASTGVRYFTKVISRGRGKPKLVYEVAATQWLDAAGVRHTASFSCAKYGKRKAYQMACAARAAALKERLKTIAKR